MIQNGDAETGTCALGSEACNPPGWSMNTNVTQIYKNTTTLIAGAPTLSGPGASTS